MDAREQVSRAVERLGRAHVGTSWWVDLAGALTDEFAPVVEERDRLRDERMSNMTVGGKRLTWQEAAGHHQERAQHEGRLAGVLADLDRCEHGRHQGDTCGSCGGPSHGNPHLQATMGYDLSATPIVMPDNPRDRRNPEAWYARAALDREETP